MQTKVMVLKHIKAITLPHCIALHGQVRYYTVSIVFDQHMYPTDHSQNLIKSSCHHFTSFLQISCLSVINTGSLLISGVKKNGQRSKIDIHQQIGRIEKTYGQLMHELNLKCPKPFHHHQQQHHNSRLTSTPALQKEKEDQEDQKCLDW